MWRALTIVCLLAFEGVGYAQHGPYRFEVVSIRETSSLSQHSQESLAPIRQRVPLENHPVFAISGNRFGSDGYLIWELIADAYQISPRFIDGPAWIRDARFAIHAIMPDGDGSSDVPQMLRAMLEDRFHLSATRTSRPLPGFNLVRGKGELRLNPARSQDLSACDPWVEVPGQTAKRCVAGSMHDGGVIAWTDGPWGPFSSWRATGYSMTEFFSSDMTQLAAYVEPRVSGTPLDLAGYKPVHDATGIEGKWSFALIIDRSGIPGETSGPNPNPPVYSVALEKPGLRLAPAKIPVEVLQVGHIDWNPTGN